MYLLTFFELLAELHILATLLACFIKLVHLHWLYSILLAVSSVPVFIYGLQRSCETNFPLLRGIRFLALINLSIEEFLKLLTSVRSFRVRGCMYSSVDTIDTIQLIIERN
jgi:hypothetical protein